MGIIPKVKCRGCDRSYSALQNKCPYCGARRTKGGKFSVPESGDPRWRLAVGVLILVAIIGSVIALVTINSKGKDNNTAASPSPSEVVSASPSTEESASPDVSASPAASDAAVSDPNTSASDTNASPAVSDANASPSPSVSSAIDSLSISWQYYTSGAAKEMTIGVSEAVELTAVIYPTSATDVDVIWTSENPSVCSVSEAGIITGVGTGQTNIVATCDGKTDSLTVRVK